MIYSIKEFAGIQFFKVEATKGFSLLVVPGSVFLSPRLLHKIEKPLSSGVRAPAFDAGVGVLDIAPNKFRVDDLIYRPLNNAVDKCLPHDKAVNRVVDNPFFIGPGAVCLVSECFLQFIEMIFQVGGKFKHFFPESLVPSGMEVGAVQIFVICHLFLDVLDGLHAQPPRFMCHGCHRNFGYWRLP